MAARGQWLLRCLAPSLRFSSHARSRPMSSEPGQDSQPEVIPVPQYTPRDGENTDTKRARLMMQSRKRGTLENGLLLSSFASAHLHQLSAEQLSTYDLLINAPDNDWQLYYWMVGRETPPPQFQSDVLDMLRVYVGDPERGGRGIQPDLSFTATE